MSSKNVQTTASGIKRLEESVRNSASLPDRLADCRRRIGEMCSDGRPPRMSVPVQWNDDDIFIVTTLEDAAKALASQHELNYE